MVFVLVLAYGGSCAVVGCGGYVCGVNVVHAGDVTDGVTNVVVVVVVAVVAVSVYATVVVVFTGGDVVGGGGCGVGFDVYVVDVGGGGISGNNTNSNA